MNIENDFFLYSVHKNTQKYSNCRYYAKTLFIYMPFIFAYISHVSQKNVMGWHEEQTRDICYTIYV